MRSWRWRPSFLQLLLLLLKWVSSSASASEDSQPGPPPPPDITGTKPDCRAKCGNIPVPYPFGIGNDCHIQEKGFNLTCSDSKLYVGYNDTQVLKISLREGRLIVNTSSVISWECYDSSGGLVTNRSTAGFAVSEDFPFTIAHPGNQFIGIGCDTEASIRANWGGDNVTETGCLSVCFDDQIVQDHPCSGVGCCRVETPPRTKSINVSVKSFSNHSKVMGFNPCSYAFLMDENNNLSASTVLDLLHDRTYKPEELKIQVVLDWTIGNQTCEEAQKNQDKFACKSKNSVCNDSRSGGSRDGYGLGYRCSCRDGYRGNPYLEVEGGCLDIDECAENIDDCQEKCVNTPGKYFCKPHFNRAALILSVILSLSCIFIVGTWIFWGLKKRKLIKLREKYFHKNGGLLLEQQINTHGASVATKIFSAEELRKATNNYDETRILGRGGYGTVYKGILVDSTIVAIKKSKIVDESQIEQFINEVFILSQINHRNVVKLLGCCLETQVPLLVYEFIFNGTLSSHIHDEARSSLSCNNRLKIASETARALAYLHYEAAIPIFHRDVKSTNILLDDNLTAKVSDFGASRLVPIDQTRISTLVQGTIGYLDPEYFHTGQLTEKSDVYSFGVVLVELLTGEKPTNSLTRSGEEKNLATYFLLSMKGNRLFQVLEDRVVGECEEEQLLAVAQLANRCLSLKGEERPTMKEVAAELERLRRFT